MQLPGGVDSRLPSQSLSLLRRQLPLHKGAILPNLSLDSDAKLVPLVLLSKGA